MQICRMGESLHWGQEEPGPMIFSSFANRFFMLMESSLQPKANQSFLNFVEQGQPTYPSSAFQGRLA
jgi:hypothetical protein